MNATETTDRIMAAIATDAGNAREVIEDILLRAACAGPAAQKWTVVMLIEKFQDDEGNFDLYGIRDALNDATAALAEIKNANDELFRIKQKVVIVNRELIRKNHELEQRVLVRT